jgi:hypothetical protein
VRQEVPMLLMTTTMIRMMVMSQMMGGRVVPFYSYNELATVCLSLSFVYNVVEH